MPIRGQHDAGRGLLLHRLPDAGRHAEANEFVAIAHRARLGIALAPTERFRTLRIALAQLLAGVGNARVLIAIRIAAQAQLDRIEAKLCGELVHRTFEPIDAGGAAGRAHIGGCREVEPHELLGQE